MPRIARAVARGFPHHVIQRGNNEEKVFFDKKDREQYLSLLKKYTDKWYLPILAYCLMTNHVHLLTKPKEEKSLYKMMQGDGLFKEGQRKDYRDFLRAGIPEEEKNRIRYSTRAVRPFGSGIFINNMEKKLGRRFILKPPGRPRKKKGK